MQDAEAVADLVQDAYRHYVERIGREPMPMRMDQAAAIRDDEVWVLEDARRIIGVLHLAAEPDHLLIVNVAVSPQRQGQRLGSRLLDFAEQRARQLDHAEVRLYTNERFVENLAIYRRRGYVETHRTPAHGTELVHMNKQLLG